MQLKPASDQLKMSPRLLEPSRREYNAEISLVILSCLFKSKRGKKGLAPGLMSLGGASVIPGGDKKWSLMQKRALVCVWRFVLSDTVTALQKGGCYFGDMIKEGQGIRNYACVTDLIQSQPIIPCSQMLPTLRIWQRFICLLFLGN